MSAGKPPESLHTVKAGGFSDMLLSPLSFAAQQLVQVRFSRYREFPLIDGKTSGVVYLLCKYIRNKSGNVGTFVLTS